MMMTPLKTIPNWLQQWWLWFALIFAGTFSLFWPSFFSAIANKELPIVVHGVSAIGWMLLTVVQAFIIKTKRRKLHRMIGYSSLVLAATLVSSAVLMDHEMIRSSGLDAIGEPLLSAKFFYGDITSLALFSIFLACAVLAARRRDIALHLRLISCTAILPLHPVILRVFVRHMPELAPDWSTGLACAFATLSGMTAVLVAIEWRYGRLRWPFLVLCGYYVLMLTTTEWFASAEWAQQLVLEFGGR